MASNAFQGSKMNEENPKTCRDIITGHDPTSSQLYNVSTITKPEPNIRIRIPKLLAKTMQRRSNGCITEHLDDHTKAMKERFIKPKSSLPEKFGLFFSSVFGKKKSPKASSKVHKNGDGYRSDLVEADDGDQPFEVAPKSSLPLLEIEEEEEEEEYEKPTMERRENKPSRAADKYLKLSFPFLSFFGQYTSLNFFRGKNNTGNGWNHTRYNSIAYSAGSGSIADTAGKTDHKTTRGQIGGESGQVREESRDECDEELCKKRILMGERCKPLNLSGTLHYDENGILLPEVFLW